MLKEREKNTVTATGLHAERNNMLYGDKNKETTEGKTTQTVESYQRELVHPLIGSYQVRIASFELDGALRLNQYKYGELSKKD